MTRRRGATGLLALIVVLCGCVSSARDAGDYVSKANKTIDTVRSSVQTVLVTVDVIDGGGAYDPYLSRVIGQAEQDASSAVNSFDVVQPPTKEGDDLRSQLDDVTGDAVDLLSEARIAIRRSDDAAVSQLRDRLDQSVDALDALKAANG